MEPWPKRQRGEKRQLKKHRDHRGLGKQRRAAPGGELIFMNTTRGSQGTSAGRRVRVEVTGIEALNTNREREREREGESCGVS